MSSSEMKRSSYYVLFLGAKESKGLRGDHYIEPVLQYFVSQDHRMQALKVTLQVSNKGLRIIPSTGKVTQSKESEDEKHFIPHSAITCVFQAPPPNDDIVSCILMIYNPDTNCPVHVHCYRCDSPETAAILKSQFETLVNREDNQRKFRDIESRLQSKGLLSCPSPSRRGTPDFDCLTSDSSENSDRGFGSGSGTSNLTSSDRVASLYDSLAAELRAKLNVRKKNTPLLLPPRDYDTAHRQRGNLSGIEARRCSNPAVVGPNGGGGQRTRRSYASREQESCGRSSGIGSAEDNGSPIHDPLLDAQPLQSSSDDEDWSQTQVVATESSQFLVRPSWPVTNLPQTPCSPTRRTAASPLPPPLPKRPELRQRSPDVSAPPPLPAFSREKFEGVRQKWETMDHQYVRQKSHDSLDEGYRSREAVEADYRRQLSRETLLRSLSRSKTGSRDSLDRWIENGVRSRGMWRKLEDEQHHGKGSMMSDSKGPGPHSSLVQTERFPQSSSNSKSGKQYLSPEKYHRPLGGGGGNKGRKDQSILPSQSSSRMDPKRQTLNPKDKSYKELGDQERFPGLDRETARSLHSSSQNLSQHIYSEPSFDSHRSSHSINKPKKFSFAFWK